MCMQPCSYNRGLTKIDMCMQDVQKPTPRPANVCKPAHPHGHAVEEKPGASDTDDTASEAPGTDPQKLFMARMRAKANRLCCRTSTGKLKVSQEIHEMWMKAGKIRDDMVELMADAAGNKDSMKQLTYTPSRNPFYIPPKTVHPTQLPFPTQDVFLKKVETYKESVRYRENKTAGGFYSEEDMKKKVSEGGLGLSQNLGFQVPTCVSTYPKTGINLGVMYLILSVSYKLPSQEVH